MRIHTAGNKHSFRIVVSNQSSEITKNRGAAICALIEHDLPVAEYAPRAIKQAIVGRGGADKAQVQHMVRMLLNMSETPAEDAADALAVALCHHNTQATLSRMANLQQ